MAATAEVSTRKLSEAEVAELDAKIGPPSSKRPPNEKEQARIAKQAEGNGKSSKPSPKKQPPKKSAPKKSAPKRQPDVEATDLAKAAKLLAEAKGLSSPYGRGDARLFLDTMSATKARGTLTITRTKDGESVKVKLDKDGQTDAPGKQALRAVTSDKAKLYPAKLLNIAIAAAARNGSAS